MYVCLKLKVQNKEIPVMCYECSRGSTDSKNKLIKYFYFDDDESVKRAVLNENEDCGSNVTLGLF